MKPTMALKPLVFALAAVMAVAAHAGGWGHNNNEGSVAAASGSDVQTSTGNAVNNEATQSAATMSSSANGSSGNIGANVAAGDGNQQDNAAAIASADESFVFGNSNTGSATAGTAATQTDGGNTVNNYSTSSSATLTGSGDASSGNIGLNVAAGDFNQQKNNLAIAVSAGSKASASSAANQTSADMNVSNGAVQTYQKTTLHDHFTVNGVTQTYGNGVAESGHGWDRTTTHFQFEATSYSELQGSASYQVLTPSGWVDPVTNVATMYNSLNGSSGNIGSNLAVGVGNQQNNSMAIATACKSCL